MADRNKGMMKSARRRVFTCFIRIFSKLEPAGIRGCDEELGIVMFGWPDDSDSAWSVNWRMIVRNVQDVFMSRFCNHTCINRELVLGAEGECCAWRNQKEMMPKSGSWRIYMFIE
jgi:hypothetical protein